MPTTSRKLIRHSLLIAIALLFIGGQILQLNIGWADNHDFRRVNQLFTDGPVGFTESDPAQDSPEYDLRYNNYWLPEWNLKWRIPSLYSAFSSTIALWLPGVLINILFVSKTTLSMLVLSLFPRLLVGTSLLLFAISLKNNKQLLVWTGFFILPVIGMMSTSHYAAYFNAFYQDVGALVYLLLLVIWLLFQPLHPDRKNNIITLVLISLLATTKASNFYFFILFIPFTVDLKTDIKKPIRLFALILLGVAVMGFSLRFVGDRSQANQYHAIFLGTLISSENPTERLAEIGITDADAYTNCKGSFYSKKGQQCAEKYAAYLSYLTPLKMILHEPKILYYHAERVAAQMQKLDIGFGLNAVDDPQNYSQPRYNLWSTLKSNYFPKSWNLYLFWGIETLLLLLYRKISTHKHLAVLALTLIAAALISMFTAILGDGVADLVKHIFIANLLFDLSSLLTLTLSALWGAEKLQHNTEAH